MSGCACKDPGIYRALCIAFPEALLSSGSERIAIISWLKGMRWVVCAGGPGGAGRALCVPGSAAGVSAEAAESDADRVPGLGRKEAAA